MIDHRRNLSSAAVVSAVKIHKNQTEKTRALHQQNMYKEL